MRKMPNGIVENFLLVLMVFFVISCTSENDSEDIYSGYDTPILDTGLTDITQADGGGDIIQPDQYFAVSFTDDNRILFYNREGKSPDPFFEVKTEGEVTSIEFIPDSDIIVYTDSASKSIVFLKGLKEFKRVENPAGRVLSMKYIEKVNMLIMPDNGSNKIYIFDIDKMDFSTLSPMAAGGNNPVSICFDESPITQVLLLRLLILNYGSLNVRAYDIFERENWGLRNEHLPTLSEPLSIACDSINRRLLIMNSSSNNISVYGLDDLVQIPNSPFEAGKNPTFAAVHKGASIAYVTNTSDDSLTIFSTKEMKAIGGISFKTGDRPHRVYVNEPESKLYVLLQGSKKLVVYDIQDPLTPQQSYFIEFDKNPGEMVYK